MWFATSANWSIVATVNFLSGQTMATAFQRYMSVAALACACLFVGCSHPKSECDDTGDCPEGQRCLSVLDRPSAPSIEVSTDTLQAPFSTTTTAPGETVVVRVTSSEITLDDESIATVESDFDVDDGDGERRRIIPLRDALTRVRGEREREAALLDQTYDPRLTIVADRAVPTELMHSVVYTARKNGFHDIRLATQSLPRQEVWRD